MEKSLTGKEKWFEPESFTDDEDALLLVDETAGEDEEFQQKMRFSATPRNMLGKRIDQDEDDFALPPEVRRSISIAIYALLAGMTAFFFTHVVSVFIIAATIDDTENLNSKNWTLVFLPIWFGNGIAIICEIVSFMYAMPIARKALMHSNDQVEMIEKTLPAIRLVTNWNCCSPMLGGMPTLPMLAVIVLFELELYFSLIGAITFKLHVFIPVICLLIFLILHWVFIADHGCWYIGNLVFFLSFTISLCLKLLGIGGDNFTWWLVCLPLWFWYCFVAFLTFNLIFQHFSRSTQPKILLATIQTWCLFGYTLALGFSFASLLLFCLSFAKSRQSLFPVATVMFGIGFALFSLSYLVVSWNHSLRILERGTEVSKYVGAGWDVEFGRVEWPLLGYVSVHTTWMNSCLSKQG